MKRFIYLGMLVILGLKAEAQTTILREDIGECFTSRIGTGQGLSYIVYGIIKEEFRGRYLLLTLNINLQIFNEDTGFSYNVYETLSEFGPGWIDSYHWYWISNPVLLGRGSVHVIGSLRFEILDLGSLELHISPVSIYESFKIK